MDWLWIGLAALSTVASLALSHGVFAAPDPLRASIFGLAILGAAFVVSWAVETIQVDFSQGMAPALLVLIVVLPEYVVDPTSTWLRRTRRTTAMPWRP